MKLRNFLIAIFSISSLVACVPLDDTTTDEMHYVNDYVSLSCERVQCEDTIAEVESKNSDIHTIQCAWACNDAPVIFSQSYSRTPDTCFELVESTSDRPICEYGIKTTQPFIVE